MTNKINFSDLCKDTFNTRPGKELMKYLCETYVLTSSFSNDPHKMAYNAGQRDLLLNILATLKSSSESHTDTLIDEFFTNF